MSESDGRNLKRDEIRTKRHRARGFCLSMISAEIARALAGHEFTSPDHAPAADGTVERLRRALDPLGGCVKRIGDRGLGLPRAVDGGNADVAHAADLLFEVADARMRI